MTQFLAPTFPKEAPQGEVNRIVEVSLADLELELNRSFGRNESVRSDAPVAHRQTLRLVNQETANALTGWAMVMESAVAAAGTLRGNHIQVNANHPSGAVVAMDGLYVEAKKTGAGTVTTMTALRLSASGGSTNVALDIDAGDIVSAGEMSLAGGAVVIGSGNKAEILLDGTDGDIAAAQVGIAESGGSLILSSRNSVHVLLDNDNTGTTGIFSVRANVATGGSTVFSVSETGLTIIEGDLQINASGSGTNPHLTGSTTNTGLYISNSEVSLTTAGVERCDVTSNGLTMRSGSIWLQDGAAGTPSLRFLGDGNVGLYRITTDELGLVTAGTLRLALRSDGDVEVPSTGYLDIKKSQALGGGATATLGTIGGSGPTAAAQNLWVEIKVENTVTWLAGWR